MKRLETYLLRAFIALAVLFIFGAPYLRQVEGWKSHYLPRWRMFSGKGLGMHSVHLVAKYPDGKREVLFINDFREEPRKRERQRALVLTSTSRVELHARGICRKLPEGTKLFARAEKAVPSGWQPALDGKRNLCRTRSKQ